MLLILHWAYTEIRKADEAYYRDKRISSWPLLGPPWKMLTIIILYLLIVKKWGPQLMANRRPYNVKLPMQIYNVFQIAFNMYIFVYSLRYTYLNKFSLSCQPYDPQNMSTNIMLLRYPAYGYYISKYLDLLDTVFFLLRKNNRQVTFLHVYHHSIMIFASWAYCTLLFASHVTLAGVINSFVHICMYSYYFTSAQKLPVDLTPWKRRLTQLQILQFCSMTIHLALPISNNYCGLDLLWIRIGFLQNFFLLLLFCDFYYKAYVVKANSTTVKKVNAKDATVKDVKMLT